MTITTQTLRNDYTANGVNTSFAFTFPIFYESNATPKFSLEVILTDISGVETIKTETVDYTITYTTIENGIISQGNVVFNVAPTNQYKVTLLRKVNLTQNSEFTASGTDKFNGATLEASLDKLTLLALQTQENLNRVVKLPKSSALTNIEFPINSSVADEVICVNSTGDNLTTKNLIDVNLAPVSTYIKTLLNDTTSAEARATLEAQKLNNNLTALASLIGSSNKIPYFTGEGAMALTDIVSSASATTQGIQYLNKPITISNNIADANNDIDFTSGNFIFSDGSGSAIASAMTKRLDANWTAGNNNGGLDTGTKAANTWYYCYAIYNPTTQASDFIFSASPTSPTLPSGFTKIRKIASIKTNISGNIKNGNYSFFVNSYRFEYKTKILIFQSTTSTTGTVVDTECPPLTIAEIIADQSSSADCSTLITSLDVDDEAPIHASYANISSSAQYNGATTLFVRTNSLAQIRRRSSGTSGTLSLRTVGWIEYI